ncbi:hypothetical protein RUND412_003001 [Rhizina undulata]
MTTTSEIPRILYICPKVHIYAVPPLTSNTGYKAAEWQVDSEKARIFTARVKIVETSTQGFDENGELVDEKVRTDVRLEDPATGELFANCPYEGSHCVEQVVDSSRFFAIRVVDGARKAILGIGFEERSEAFDFGVALQEVRRYLGLEVSSGKKDSAKKPKEEKAKMDYRLKEGEMINITIGSKGRRRAPSSPRSDAAAAMPLPFLPPPPSAQEVKKRQSKHDEDFGKLGFDDDAFGDFV